MLSALKKFLTPSPIQQQAHAAYLTVVAQSRLPVFYHDWHIADTVDGRFDVIVLHLFLVMERCGENAAFCRALCETFFADMDRSLREMGVGDTGVGKRIRSMAEAFYGRLKAYGEAADDSLLKEALCRNAYRGEPVAREALQALVDYLRRQREHLRAQNTALLLRGDVTFSS